VIRFKCASCTSEAYSQTDPNAIDTDGDVVPDMLILYRFFWALHTRIG